MSASSVAVVGAGYWGRNLVRNFHELGALAAVCEVDAATREELSDSFPDTRFLGSFEEILADSRISAVAIATPATSHGQLVRQALEANKDVLVEKPLSMSVHEGEDLVALARDKRRVLMVGHLLWYHPAVTKLKELVDAGELGRIRYVSSHRLNLGKIRREENILWSFAPHDISVILGLVNEMPDRVQSQGGNYLHEQIADLTLSFLTFPSGVKAHIFVSWLHPFKEQKLVVVGDRKMAVFDDTLAPEQKLLLYPHSIDWKDQAPVALKRAAESVPVESREPLREECKHFLDCIETRKTPRTDGEEGVRVLRVLEHCQNTLQGNETVPKAYRAHPSAFIDEGVTIGEGTVIWHVSHIMNGSKIGNDCRIGQNVVIGPDVTIGNDVKIQNNVSVYKGVTLEDGVFCGPSMVFTNVINPRSEIRRMDELLPTTVRRGATLGANCTILCGTTIGRYAFVAAGAVVTRDVADYSLVLGNPARHQGYMCRCGVKLDAESVSENVPIHCGSCRREYRLDLSGLHSLSSNS